MAFSRQWILSVVLFFAFASQALNSKEPFGRIHVNKWIEMPDQNGHVDWVDAIKNAKSSIHMMMYHLTDKQVVDALVARKSKKRPIDIKIIVDGKSFSGGYKKAAQPLDDAGIEIKPSSRAFSITHAKSMVIDGETAFITSINLTNTATNSRDYGVITDESAIIDEMEKVFEADWKNADDDGDSTPELTQENLAWSPNNSLDKLVKLIDSSNKSLVAEVESFSSDEIISAFNRAAARNVEVKLIVPECVTGPNGGFNYQYLSRLKGVKVHTQHNGRSVEQPYVHAKMMVADNKRVYVGSINFSYNSTLKARELGLIFLDEEIGQKAVGDHDEDWARSDEPDPSACRGSKDNGAEDNLH